MRKRSIILPAVFYIGVRFGSAAPREERRLRVFDVDIWASEGRGYKLLEESAH
jgi:hypothetical protein